MGDELLDNVTTVVEGSVSEADTAVPHDGSTLYIIAKYPATVPRDG